MTNKKESVQVVTVLNKFSFGSNYRMVRRKIVIHAKKERIEMAVKSTRMM